MEKQQFKDKDKGKGKGKAVEVVEYHPWLIGKRKRSDEVSPKTQMKVFTYLYERSVETAFQYHIEKHMLFKHLLNGFTEDRISEAEVKKKMNILLQGHGKLLLGLKRFLCSYYELKSSAKLMDALNFITKVKERYGGDSIQYKIFRSILNSYKNNTASSREIYDVAVILFKDQHDLLKEFTKFLPVAFMKKGKIWNRSYL